jgi:putative tricarboxylic transport membrane protein
MDIFSALMQGFASAITVSNLLWCFVGCALGTAVGVLPGIGPAVAVAMLLPDHRQGGHHGVDDLLLGIYYGAMYGGSTTSILLNTPGETASMVTAMEGNKMAKSGRAGAALATAAIGSFVAGTIATAIVTLFAPYVAEFAVKLGPPEYFMLMVLAFTTVSAVLGKSTLRGMTALFVGLASRLHRAGPDLGPAALHHGHPRTDGRHRDRAGGRGPVCRGRGAVRRAVRRPRGRKPEQDEPGPHDRARLEALRAGLAARHGHRHAVWLHSGRRHRDPDLPELRHREKKLAKPEDRAEFGNAGAIEGVAGPEAANNATVTAALIPLLTLGIPTSNTTAILLGAFQNYGIQPGPQLFTTSAALVWALIASLYIGNVMLLVLNLPMVGLWVKLLKIPKPQLYAGILIFATVGAYGMRQSAFDLVLLYAIGVLGVLMRRFDFPTAPVVVGMILGPLAEAQMRNAVSIGEGSFLVFLQRPMSLTLLIIIVLVLILPRLFKRRAARLAAG